MSRESAGPLCCYAFRSLSQVPGICIFIEDLFIYVVAPSNIRCALEDHPSPVRQLN